jgi:hypothetical protein
VAIAPASAALGTAAGGGASAAPVVSTLAEFTAQVDDLDLTGIDIARISSDARREVTGIVAATVDGTIRRLMNVGSNPIALLNENANSAVANRIVTGLTDHVGSDLGAIVTIPPAGSAVLLYDSTQARWVVIGLLGKDDANYVWSFSGTLSTAQNLLIPRLAKAHDHEVYALVAYVKTSPTGQDIIATVAGGSLSENLTITPGSTTSGFSTPNPAVFVAAGTVLSMSITQVGSGVLGDTLTVIAFTRPA